MSTDFLKIKVNCEKHNEEDFDDLIFNKTDPLKLLTIFFGRTIPIGLRVASYVFDQSVFFSMLTCDFICHNLRSWWISIPREHITTGHNGDKTCSTSYAQNSFCSFHAVSTVVLTGIEDVSNVALERQHRAYGSCVIYRT